MNAAPPPRYRVVERGRRLEVIDTRAKATPVAMSVPASGEPPMPSPVGWARYWPQRTRFDGTAQVVTHRLYDAKAPRTIRLDPVLAARFEWTKGVAVVVLVAFVACVAAFPWIVAAPVLVHLLGARTSLRRWATRRIDRIVAQG